jgi:hypothetical protein
MVKTYCTSICCFPLECRRNRGNFDKREVFRRGITFAVLDMIYAFMFSRTLGVYRMRGRKVYLSSTIYLIKGRSSVRSERGLPALAPIV